MGRQDRHIGLFSFAVRSILAVESMLAEYNSSLEILIGLINNASDARVRFELNFLAGHRYFAADCDY